MKRIVCISVLALFAILIVSSLSIATTTWKTDRETVRITSYTADQTLPSNFSTVNIDIVEKDIGTPSVNGVWSVSDKITVTNNLGFNITNLTLNISYREQAKQKPITSKLISQIDDGNTSTFYIEYQKKGPYFDESDIEGTTITITSYEDLKGVTWTFDPKEYSAFSGLDSSDDLTIHQDGSILTQGSSDDDHEDWYWDENGLIVFDSLTFDEDENQFEFSWTTPAVGNETYQPETPVTQEPFYMQEVAGIPVFIIVAVLAVLVIVIVIAGKK